MGGVAAFAVFSQFLFHNPVLIQFLLQFLFQFLFTVLLAGPRQAFCESIKKSKNILSFFATCRSLVLVALPA